MSASSSGGGMRQAGILAAAGIVALDTLIPRLADDHAHAKLLAEALSRSKGVRVAPVETNIVVATLEGRAAPDVVAVAPREGRPGERHGRCARCGSSRTRTSSREDCERGAGALEKVLG